MGAKKIHTKFLTVKHDRKNLVGRKYERKYDNISTYLEEIGQRA
jgi:hypothetical protein